MLFILNGRAYKNFFSLSPSSDSRLFYSIQIVHYSEQSNKICTCDSRCCFIVAAVWVYFVNALVFLPPPLASCYLLLLKTKMFHFFPCIRRFPPSPLSRPFFYDDSSSETVCFSIKINRWAIKSFSHEFP